MDDLQEQIRLSVELSGALQSLQAAARRIGDTSKECKLDVVVEDYVEAFRPSLMDVIYSWSKGASFAEVCGMTDLFEGSIIR